MTLDLRRFDILFGVLDVKNESGMLLSWSTCASGLKKLPQLACELKTLQLAPKLSYNPDLDQVGYLLRPITDLDVCLSPFFGQTPRGEFFRFGTSMS